VSGIVRSLVTSVAEKRVGAIPYAVALRVKSALSAVVASADTGLRFPLPARCASILYLRALWLTAAWVRWLLVASWGVPSRPTATCCR
jgi:hypothetical protein